MKMVKESLYEFAQRGRPRKNPIKPKKAKKIKREGFDDEESDDWHKYEEEEEVDPDELDVDVSDMTDAEEIDIEESAFDDQLLTALKNELKSPEFARRVLKFRMKGDMKKKLLGTPLAKMGESSFLFKMKDGSTKKINLTDIIAESIVYPNQLHLNEHDDYGFEDEEGDDFDYDSRDKELFSDSFEDEEYDEDDFEDELGPTEDEDEFLMTAGHLFPERAREITDQYTKTQYPKTKRHNMPF